MPKNTKNTKSRKTVRTTKATKTTKVASKQPSFLMKHLAAIIVVLIVAIGGTYLLVGGHADSPSAVTDSCTVSAELVNSCRPWIGANVYGYPQAASDLISQAKYQSNQIGHQYDIIHSYHPVGNNQLSSTEDTIVNTPGQMLFTDWNPVNNWGDIASQNAGIDQMAASIKALGSHKIFMTLWHEPENNVSANGDPKCPSVSYKGTNGSVADYRNMWIYVHNRFAADGVTNVVWSLDFINYTPWDCLIPDLYPGDQYVDWIWFNNYDDSGPSWSAHLAHFYDLLTNDNNPSIGHSFLSKPWGVVEWSVGHGTEAQQISYINQAKASLDSNEFPRMKGYMVWDSNQVGFNDRVGYDSLDNSQPDPAKEAAYINYAKDPRFTDAFYQGTVPPPVCTSACCPSTTCTTPPPPAKDTTPPSVTLTAPANGDKVSGAFTVSGTASDNVGVVAVTLRIDDTYVATAKTAPYNFALNTSSLTVGNHTLVLRAFDAANNMGQSATITIDVVAPGSTNPGGGTPPVVTNPGTPITINGNPTIVFTTGSSVQTVIFKVKGNVTIAVPNPTQPATITVDNKPISSDIVAAGSLTNGDHTVTVTQDGQSSSQKIDVDNPWPTAAKNEIEAHPVAYTTGGGATLILLVLAGWYARKYFGQAVYAFQTRKFVTFGGGKKR